MKVDGISINQASDLLGIPRSTGKAVMKKLNRLNHVDIADSTHNRGIENINIQWANFNP